MSARNSCIERSAVLKVIIRVYLLIISNVFMLKLEPYGLYNFFGHIILVWVFKIFMCNDMFYCIATLKVELSYNFTIEKIML